MMNPVPFPRDLWCIIRRMGFTIPLLAAVAPTPASPSPAPAPGTAAAASSSSAQRTDPARPITDNTVTAGDVATTPLSDLNIKKHGIPPLLLAAQAHPYTLEGLGSCPRLAGAVRGLDAILGADVDSPEARAGRANPGGIAQSVVGSFIPFRGVIREVSGANAHEKRVQAAIYAGTARRSFLKGVGLARGCRAPARPHSTR